MVNLEKVQAVLKFADEKFSSSGDGASEMDEWLDGTDVLLEDGRYSTSQLGMAASMAFYADHVTKVLRERIAELERLNADLDKQNLLMCAKSDIYYCDGWLAGSQSAGSDYADGYMKATIEARRANAAKIVREMGIWK